MRVTHNNRWETTNHLKLIWCGLLHVGCRSRFYVGILWFYGQLSVVLGSVVWNDSGFTDNGDDDWSVTVNPDSVPVSQHKSNVAIKGRQRWQLQLQTGRTFSGVHQHGRFLHMKAPEFRCCPNTGTIQSPAASFPPFSGLCECLTRADGCKTVSRKKENKLWWTPESLTVQSAAMRIEKNHSFPFEFYWNMADCKSNFSASHFCCTSRRYFSLNCC